jgi:hypothetical protein
LHLPQIGPVLVERSAFALGKALAHGEALAGSDHALLVRHEFFVAHTANSICLSSKNTIGTALTLRARCTARDFLSTAVKSPKAIAQTGPYVMLPSGVVTVAEDFFMRRLHLTHIMQ